MISRDDLVADLANVSHQTWMRHVKQPRPDPPPRHDDPTPTAHDIDRAGDIVDRLVELGIYSEPASSPAP